MDEGTICDPCKIGHVICKSCVLTPLFSMEDSDKLLHVLDGPQFNGKLYLLKRRLDDIPPQLRHDWVALKLLSAPIPIVENMLSDSNPIAEKKLSDSNPITENKLSDSNPIAEKKLSDSNPIAENKLSDSIPIPGNKLAASTPSLDNKLAASTPNPDNKLAASTLIPATPIPKIKIKFAASSPFKNKLAASTSFPMNKLAVSTPVKLTSELSKPITPFLDNQQSQLMMCYPCSVVSRVTKSTCSKCPLTCIFTESANIADFESLFLSHGQDIQSVKDFVFSLTKKAEEAQIDVKILIKEEIISLWYFAVTLL